MPDKKINQSPAPGAEHKLLDVFIGRWKTEGQINESPFGSAGKIIGTDTYEWLPGGFFLIHHIDVRMGETNNKAIEIIGYDASKRLYSMHSFDNLGNNIIMRACVDGNTWIFSGEQMRFTGTFSVDRKTLTGKWEYLEDDLNWRHWMNIKLTKKA